MISFACACGRAFTVKPEMAGRKIRCPACNQWAIAPSLPSDAPIPAPAAQASPAPLPPAKAPLGQTSRPVVREQAPVPWKGMAITGMVFGFVALVISVILGVMPRNEKPHAPPANPAESEEVRRIRQSLQERDRELAALREAMAKGDDPAKFEKYLNEIAALKRDRDQLATELTRSRDQVNELTQKVRRLEVASSPPSVPAPSAQPLPPPADKTIADLAEKCAPAVAVIKTNLGSGAGFFVSTEGWLVTNYHVIAESKAIEVVYVSNRQRRILPGRAWAVDAKNDLALLKVENAAGLSVLPLGVGEPLRVGDPVIAIGNPGVGNVILDYTISNGIISSSMRQIEDRQLMQITAPVNPGNSGGPLLSMKGLVIGVVTAKAVDKENINFAVPVGFVQALLDNREGGFRVPGTLEEWEKKSAVAGRPKTDTSRGIPLNTQIVKLVVDESGDRVVALDRSANSLLVASISDRKVLGTIYTGSEPVDFQLTAGGKQAWVANFGSKNLVRIDLEKKEIAETVGLSFAPTKLALVKGLVWYVNLNQQLAVYNPSDKKDYHTPVTANSLAYDSKRDRLLFGNTPTVLGEIDPAKVAGMVKEAAHLNKPESAPAYAKAVGEIMKTLKMHSFQVDNSGYSECSLLMDEKNGKVYYNRTAFKSDRLDSTLGFFKPNPYSLSADPNARFFMARYPQVDQLLTASPDGKWVTNGTHIFSADHFTAQKELPIPTLWVSFSRDSKILYYFDLISKMVLPLELEKP